jgi:Cysteine-rich secretory protein family
MKSYFVPLPHHNYIPVLLQRGAMVGMLILAVVTFTFTNVYSLLWQQSSWLVGAVLPAVVINLTNTEREEAVLSPLTRNTVLDEAARLKAEHMAKYGYFAHYSPDGVSPWYWFNEVGYNFVHAGENLAVHFTDSDAVVEAWMLSPTHRANIVNNNYREIGVGTARGTYQGFPTVFVVQLFGTPAVATPAVVAALPSISVPPVASGASLPVPVPAATVAGIESVEVATNEPDTPVVHVGMSSMESGLAASTTTATPKPLETITTPAPALGVTAALVRPTLVLQTVYLVIGFMVALALILSVCIAWRQHRPRHVAYGTGLLLVLSVLFYIHVLVSGQVTIL